MTNIIQAAIALLVVAALQPASAEETAPEPAAEAQTAEPDVPQEDIFPPEQIEQLVAPIALYPDALLAQIMMGSTYPLDIVQAARWVVE